MTEGERESIKLHSNYLNGMAISIFAIGCFGFLQKAMADGSFLTRKFIVTYAIAGMLSYLFHTYARWKVRRLDRDLPK